MQPRWAERLDELLPEGRQVEVAIRLGVDSSTLSNWRTGRRTPDANKLVALCDALQVTSDYLLGLTDDPCLPPVAVVRYDLGTGEAPAVREMITDGLYSAATAAPMVLEVAGTRFVPIPKLRDPIAAGVGVLSSGATDGILLVREDELRRQGITGPLWPTRIVGLDVIDGWLGESMVPTIEPGAQLLADRGADPAGPSDFRDGGIYLVRTDKGVTCKRVWLTGRALNCHADNRRVPPIVIPLRKTETVATHVLARVFHIANPAR